METSAAIFLKPGREKSLLQRHPWVFSGAIGTITGDPVAGSTVNVYSSAGEFLAYAAYSPLSQIRLRIWSWQAEEKIGTDFLRARLRAALDCRERIDANAYRLVHAESDGLPGLVVDRYHETLVMQCLSWGAEAHRDTLANLLLELTGACTLYERSDADVRKLEGLPERCGLLAGKEPPERIEIQEADLMFLVDIRKGHKTGFYLDQRDNRRVVAALSRSRDVLDCFSYTGGFTLSALSGGARHVLAVDSSVDALRLAIKNLDLNGFAHESIDQEEGDVFQVLRKLRDRGQSFDMIILDPPKFAPTIAQAERAARGYKDINMLALKLLRPGGLLVTFSCSGGISPELFQKIVAGAALDAHAQAQILLRLYQGRDHPVALNFPEGAYLKGLVIRVV